MNISRTENYVIILSGLYISKERRKSMRFPKKITSLVLAAVMVLSNIGNVYATTDTTTEKKKDSYTVTINETDNGVINFEASEETVENFDAGDTVEVKMTPDEGYMVQYFQIISDDTGKVLANVETTDDTFSFTMPKKNITVSGGFVEGDYEVVEGDNTTNYISLNLDEDIVEETADISKETFDTLDDSVEPDEVITVSDYNTDGLSQTAHTIKLNYTILDADKVTSKTTIENMWEDSGETVFAVYTKEVPVYIMKDNPDVCVAFINPGIMNNTGSYVDVCFVSDSDEDPVDLTDVISFDEENGIAYIPKSFYYDEEGNESDIIIRSQIAVARDLSDDTNDIKVTIENNSSLVKAVAEEEIVKADSYDVTTTFPLLTTDTTSNFDIDKVHVYINDSEVEYGFLSDNWYLDSKTGYFTIIQAPVTTYSIKVVIDDSSFTEALKTVISTPANALSSYDDDNFLALEGVELPISVTDKDGKSTTLKKGQIFSYDGKTRYYASEILPTSATDSNFSDSSKWTLPNFSSNRYHVVIHQSPSAPSGYTKSTCKGTGTTESGSLYCPSSTEAGIISEWKKLMTGTSSLNYSSLVHAYTGDYIDFFMAPPTDTITSDDGSLTVNFGDFSDWIGDRYDFKDSDGSLYNYARREASMTANYEIYGTSGSSVNYYGKSTVYYSRSNEEMMSYLPLSCGHFATTQEKTDAQGLISSDAKDGDTSHMKILYVNTDKKYFVAEFYAGYTAGNQVPVGIYKIYYTDTTSSGVTITKKASSAYLKRVDKNNSDLKTSKYSKICKSDMYDLTSGTTFAIWTDSNCSEPATLYKDKEKTDAYDNNRISTKKGSNKTKVFYVDDGDYWVTEVKAPRGYNLVTGKEGKKHMTVSGSSTNFTYKDTPLGDPFDLTLTKTGSGNTGLNGAEFTLYYYLNDEDYDNDDYTYSWVFETKNSGNLELTYDYLKSGRINFKDNNDNDKYDEGTDEIFWPAGYYRLKETTPPTGYLNSGTFSINSGTSATFKDGFDLTIIEKFVADGNGWKTQQTAKGVTATGSTITVNITNNTINANVTDYEKRGGLAIQKVDSDTNTNVSQSGGNMTATFGIKNTGSKAVYLDTNGDMVGDTKLDAGKTYNVTTGTDGRFYSNPTFLPIGTYEVSEVTPPVGYSGTTFRSMSR
jgi:hypothetical protein